MKIIKPGIKDSFYILIERRNKIGVIFIELPGQPKKLFNSFFIAYFCNIHVAVERNKDTNSE
jgi:hypothetical protein